MDANQSRQWCYDLGRAVGLVEAEYDLTPGCVGNLSELPHRAPVILRHVWDRLARHEAAGGLVEGIDWTRFRPTPDDRSALWFGLAAGRKAAREGARAD